LFLVPSVDSVVVSSAEVDASLVFGKASVEVIVPVDAYVETGIVGVVTSFASVVVSIAEFGASLVVFIASVEVIE
jgi:hypothetical protein